MNGTKAIGWIFLMLVLLNRVSAQSYLQFVENKGQWHEKVAFKGELAAGAFFLEPDGSYKIVLHNHDDLRALIGQQHATSVTGPAIDVQKANAAKAKLILHSHAYEVKFLHSNPTPEILKEKPETHYRNYFIGNDASKWTGGCKLYRAITFKNLYPNIDIRYYTAANGTLKYDLIVHPGGDVNSIAMYVDGADGIKVKNGGLRVKTSVDEVQEGVPVSYLSGPAGKQETPCSYDVKGNIIRFSVKEQMPASTTLIIDPSLVFASFSGSKADNWGYTATYDAAGNFYAGGIVFNTGYQVTTGAFQTNFAGGNNNTGEGGQGIDISGFDIGIMKFNAKGTVVQYATYIGGSGGNEQPHSMVVDGSGNLVIAGRTTSGNTYPTLPAGTSIGPGGGQDIILTKLNATGTALIGSLRIGGTADDGVNIASKDMPAPAPQGTASIRRNYGDDARSEVVLDNAGNIYLASCTQSTDFQTTNPFQNSNKGATSYHQNAVIIKAAPDLSSILFSSYLGGTGDDAAFAIALNPVNNNIYLAGATSSKDFPGAINTFNGGACDGFVAIINNTANPTLASSSYFGTASADQLYGIQFNKTGQNVFISGTTEGVMPYVNSNFNTVSGQKTGNQFITKLSADLTTVVYSANYGNGGTSPNISPAAFLVDVCENVYVSGWGGGLDRAYTNQGVSGLTIKAAPDGSQPLFTTTDGNGFYFFVLEKNANSQLYGGYFGEKVNQTGSSGDLNGVHVDGGTSRFDKNGVVYQSICACGPDKSSTTAGVAYPNNGAYQSAISGNAIGGFSCNLLALKVAFNLTGVMSGVQSSINGVPRDTSGCLPLTVTFTDTIGNAQQYYWTFGDGSAQVTTTTPTTNHLFKQAGLYRVMEIAFDATKCNQYDTSYVNIRVRNDAATLSLSAVKIPPCNSLAYKFTNSSVAPPGKAFNSKSFSLDFGDGSTPAIIGDSTLTHAYPAAGLYNVRLTLLDTNFCNYTDSFPLPLTIAANVKAQFTTPTIGCLPYLAVFDNTSLGSGATTYIWDFGDGSTSTAANPTHTYTNAGTYKVRLIANDVNTCNLTDTSVYHTISVLGKPSVDFSASPQPPRNNTPITFTNLSSGGVTYQWTFGDGDTINTFSLASVSHIYNISGLYNVCLHVTNQAGCIDSLCQTVSALITPLFDVPNAFSPNGDGVNDRIYVRGFGITEMKWNIYNRWGTLVYQSSDLSQGWDGSYKGVLQPMDVYQYVLEVKMSDGNKYFKKGDINLVR